MYNKNIHLDCEKNHCERCGDCIEGIRILCDICRKPVGVVKNSYYVEEKVRPFNDRGMDSHLG